MVRELILTGKFKKSLKLAKKRGLNINALDEVVTILQNDISLDMRYCDHEFLQDSESAIYSLTGC